MGARVLMPDPGHNPEQDFGPTFDLDNPPWAAEEFGGLSDKWGDEQDRSEWFEAAAQYWCARATAAEARPSLWERTE